MVSFAYIVDWTQNLPIQIRCFVCLWISDHDEHFKLNRIEWSIVCITHTVSITMLSTRFRAKSEQHTIDDAHVSDKCNAMNPDVMFHFHICPVSHRNVSKLNGFGWLFHVHMQHCCLNKIYIVITEFRVVWPRELFFLFRSLRFVGMVVFGWVYMLFAFVWWI